MLEHYGFKVLFGIDRNQLQMERLVEEFLQQLRNSRVRLFYYSGHGLQVENQNIIWVCFSNSLYSFLVLFFCLNQNFQN
jgi:uncharacterized caspase-like protein